VKPPIDPPFNATESLEKYPKILDYGREHAGARCLAFEKHDGTNLAFRWDGERFGPGTFRSGRTVLQEGGVFGSVSEILLGQLWPGCPLLRAVEGEEDAAYFAEFRGPRSFSGEHERDDPKTLHPIDLWIKGKGFVPPATFAAWFSVPLVYQGKLTADFVERVRSGKVGVNEGVVCKGGGWGSVWCCKIKTRAWLARGGEP
jgi:hypothetical protein